MILAQCQESLIGRNPSIDKSLNFLFLLWPFVQEKDQKVGEKTETATQETPSNKAEKGHRKHDQPKIRKEKREPGDHKP